ncbi:enediyne antibiotic chromoprotein [Streptomyces albireticuli]|uniref:enediyne antibiotic chromoprotein n=1 Tax=Streptomyces albireticuli TaxID=1940 RepID=UPI003696E9F3
MNTRSRHSLRTGAAAAVTLGIGALLAGPAFAAGPALTATPGTGLSSGQTITAAGHDFAPGSKVGVAECALDFTQRVACDSAGIVYVTVGQDGKFSVPVTVRKTFKGYNPQTGQETGAVDAATEKVGLTAVLMSDVAKPLANVGLSFS